MFELGVLEITPTHASAFPKYMLKPCAIEIYSVQGNGVSRQILQSAYTTTTAAFALSGINDLPGLVMALLYPVRPL
jgi:hypothetical protein